MLVFFALMFDLKLKNRLLIAAKLFGILSSIFIGCYGAIQAVLNEVRYYI